MPDSVASRGILTDRILVDSIDNPTVASPRLNTFYYFAYGHNMWIDEMKHCITPKARLVGVAYLPNYKFFLTTRHRPNIIEATPEERSTLPKHSRRVYGLVWEVPWGTNDHLRRNEPPEHLETSISERLDLMEGARLNARGTRAKSSHYKSEHAIVKFVTVPELDGERRRYVDAIGGYPQGEITCRIYRDASRVKPYYFSLPHFRLIMNMGFADFLNLYHEKRYVDSLRVFVPIFLPDKLSPVMNRDYYKLLEQMSEVLDRNGTFDFDDRRSSIYQPPDQNERNDAATVSSRGRVGDTPDTPDNETESNYTQSEARNRSEVSGAKSSRASRSRRGNYDLDDDVFDDDEERKEFDDHSKSKYTRSEARSQRSAVSGAESSRVSHRHRGHRGHRVHHHHDDDDYDDDEGQSSVRRDRRDHDDDDHTELSRHTRRTRVVHRGHKSRHDDGEEDDYYSRAQSSRRSRRHVDDDSYDDHDDRTRMTERTEQTERTERTERTARTRGSEHTRGSERTHGAERRDNRDRDDDGRARRVTARSVVSRAPTAASSASSEYELVLAEVGGKGGRAADRRGARPRHVPVLDDFSESDDLEQQSVLLIQQEDVRLQTQTLGVSRALPSRPRRDRARAGVRSDNGSVYPDPKKSNKITISYS